MRSSVEEIECPAYEKVTIFRDSQTDLLAIVAIHSTVLGPALGGCRMKKYRTLDRAIEDVLRLAEGMTLKNSLAGLNLGGGKSVILGDRARTEGRKELFLEFGECVKSLGGKYITAEDMGTNVADIDVVASVCPFVSGRGVQHGGGGDPSPHTAEGVFQGIRAALGVVYGSEDFTGRHVAIQGVGNVGLSLAQKLAAVGAKLTIADNRPKQIEKVSKMVDAKVVPLGEIYQVACDVFSPCAIGAVLNPETVGKLQCKIIAGAANNQLSGDEVENDLSRRSIVYVPDFAVNSGGVILCAGEQFEDGYNEPWVKGKVADIYKIVLDILQESQSTGQLAGEVALQRARQRIEQGSGSQDN